MKLRIRCPSCRTVLSVPPGAVPTCPTCGFGAAGDPQQPSQDPAMQGEWREPQPGEGWADVGEGAGPPAHGEGGEAWQPAEGAEGEGWQPAEGEWNETAQTPQGWGEPPAAPKKRGLFGRRKK